jgi:hypothetical protein
MQLPNCRTALLAILLFLLLLPQNVLSGPYLSSAHGNNTYGVDRSDSRLDGYSKGNCSHCHEMHGSIQGGEPDPVAGSPSPYTLFYTNHVDQNDNFCFQCHVDSGSVQQSGFIINRSYSSRAGNWTSDTVDDIKEAFNNLTSSHNLDDILTFIDGKWGYTSNSNPCAACHNPHAVQGDPANSVNGAKSSSSRGYPISRPSQHTSSPWPLWGDDTATESMWSYAGANYQALYRYNTTSFYEPQGDSTATAQQTVAENTTDFVSFCTDCHDNTNVIASTSLGRNLYQFSWAAEMHGGQAASDDTGNDLQPPYVDASSGIYVLSCMDCHEAHGSPNPFLVRNEVNNTVVNLPGGRGDWRDLCQECHADISNAHHIINPGDCTWNCHYLEWDPDLGANVTVYRECVVCHYHGSTQIWNGTTNAYEPYGQSIF